MKKIGSILLRASISIALLVFLFAKIDFASTLKLIQTIDIRYLFIAFSIFFIIYVFIFYRWKMLLDAQAVQVPFKLILRSFCGGMFFNLFLPSTIGGDVSRSLDLSLYTKRKSVVVASVLLDRLSGFVGLLAVAIISLMFGYRLIREPSVYMLVFVLMLFLAGLMVIIFSEGMYKKLNRSSHKEGGFWDNFRKLHRELYFFRSKPFVLCLNLFYSIVIQTGSSLVSFFLLRSVHIQLHLVYPLVFTPLITIITTIPIGIGGLGVRDASSIFFYTKIGVAKDAALAQSLLNFLFVVFWGLGAGILYVSTFHYRRIQPHQADPALK